MSKNHHFEIGFQLFEYAFIVSADRFRRNSRNLSNNCLDIRHANLLFALRFRQKLLISTRLIYDVNGFVRQEAVGDVTSTQIGGNPQSFISVLYVVVFFEPRLEAAQYAVSIVYRGLDNINFLESTTQRFVFIKNAPVFSIGRGTNAL